LSIVIAYNIIINGRMNRDLIVKDAVVDIVHLEVRDISLNVLFVDIEKVRVR